VLRFIPQSDLGVLDPNWTAAYVTRNHAMMAFGTLYGTDSAFRVSPQMVARDTTSDDGLTRTLTLGDGLLWHDGENVLARDCLAASAARPPATASARPSSRSLRGAQRRGSPPTNDHL